MKTTYTSTTARLRRLTLLLLAGLLLVLVGGGQGRAAARTQTDHLLSQALALHPQIPATGDDVPILDGAIASNSSRVDLYVSAAYTGTFQKTWNGASWAEGPTIWGNTAVAPSAVAQDQVGPIVFSATTVNSIVWQRPNWERAEPPDGTLPGITTVSRPAAVSWGGTRFDVIAWGIPFNIPVLVHDYSNDDGATWAWEGLPYLMQADPTLQPTIVSRGANSLDIFALGTDHALYYLNWNGSTWGQWQNLGGFLLYGQVAALPLSPTQLEVYGIGRDGGLYRQVLTYARYWPVWSGWQYVGGSQIHTAPTVVAWGGGNRTVCMLGGDNALWCADGYGSSPTGWSWYSLGGAFAPYLPTFLGSAVALPPISVTVGASTVMVFAEDSNEIIWTNRAQVFTPHGFLPFLAWGGWQSLGTY